MGSSSAVTCEGACSLGVYTTIYRSAVGNALVAIIGTVPGYWFTVAFVDKWGRVPIQYMGFAMMTTLLVILAAAYPQVRERGAPCLLLVERERDEASQQC
jgi:MFS transporter, PHS family, inorganic phosphate transporter